MKICRFDNDRLGIVIGDKVHDVTAAQDEIRKSAPYDMKGDAVIAALPQWRKRFEEMAAKAPQASRSRASSCCPRSRGPRKPWRRRPTTPPTSPRWRRAAPDPNKENLGKQSPKIQKAGIFLKANSSIVGPSEGIPLRFLDRANEHEAEIVAHHRQAGHQHPREKAYDYIAGYCLGLDMTCRGPEDRSFRKSIDGYSPLGPWIVTADEIKDPANLPIKLTVNDEPPRQNSNTSQLIFDIPRLIEFASTFYTLYPGDVYYTGTPEGVGPVKPGDWIKVKSAPELGELKIQVRANSA